MENLTEKQQAAILYHVFTGCKDRAILFQIAEGETRFNKLTEKSKRNTVSVWFNSEKIQEGIKDITYQIEKFKREIIEKERVKWESEGIQEAEKSSNSKDVNFLDRDQFLEFLNKKANTIQDDKLRNDILKMLSDNLRYKDTDTTENNEIQRFYTPVVCSECEIYNKCKSCNVENCKK